MQCVISPLTRRYNSALYIQCIEPALTVFRLFMGFVKDLPYFLWSKQRRFQRSGYGKDHFRPCLGYCCFSYILHKYVMFE